MRARVRRIRQRLAEVYGVPELPAHGDPIAELVLTVLSQSTSDRDRDVAYLRLRERLPTWRRSRCPGGRRRGGDPPAACVLLFDFGMRDVAVDTQSAGSASASDCCPSGAPPTRSTTRCSP